MKKKRGFHFFEAGLLLYLNFNLQAIEFYGILLIKRKKTPKGVIFSDYICTFAMSFRVLFVFLQH